MTIDTTAMAEPDSALEQGWQEYHAYIEETRKRLLARPEMQDPTIRMMAHQAIASLVAGGINFYMTPRQDCPIFYRDAIWGPIFAWGGPSSDMVYRWCFLDGRHDYRITGRRGTVLFTDFHMFDGYLGVETMKDLGNFDLDGFEMDADGRFEIIASATRKKGNWLPLDAGVENIAIQLREVWWDWAYERGTELHVERIDDGPRRMLHDEPDFIRRLHWAGRLVEQMILRSLGYGKMVRRLAGGANVFSIVQGAQSNSRDYGASPRAGYICAYWDLMFDEALIIEGEAPDARYWSFQLMSPFWDTLDFNQHQSGLNGHQIQRDVDGRYRAVLSLQDPGVPNWLDPVGLSQGQCLFRLYDATSSAIPTTRVVKLAEVRDHLPADYPMISPTMRAESMRERSRSSLRRWHY